MTMMKKTMALALAMIMLIGLLPMGARASEAEEAPRETEEALPVQTETAEVPQLEAEEEALTEATQPAQETALLPGLEVTQPEADVEFIPTQVNPLYADTYTADDFDIPAFPSDTGAADIMATNEFVSKEEAAAQLRTQMTKRADTITVYVQGPISNTKQTAYDLIDMAMVHTGNPKEGDYLMWHWATWGAQITKQWNGSSYDYIYEYAVTYYTTYNQEYELDNYILSLIWQLNIRNASDYQKVKAVYDYMCKNITYDDTNPDDYMLKYTAYAALVNKTAACQGYATLFYRVMLELGVDCRVIAGIGGGGAHGWNIVELDGVYYNLDATWDAGMTEYNYFLVSTWNYLDHARYLEYETWEFHEAYPMAAENYVPGEKGEIDPYIYLGICGDDALFLLCRDGTLEIGGTGATYDYVDSNDLAKVALWQYWWNHITKVIVHDGITTIGNYNFFELSNLVEVSLPGSVTTIGKYAFGKCTGLTQLEVGNGLAQIQSYAFANCTGLKSVSLPESLTEIQSYAFTNCTALAELKLAESPTYIAKNAFNQCNSLTELTVPGTITYLSGFGGCAGLAEVTICEGITRVENGAFSNCKALTDLSLPESLVTIGTGSFSGSGLTELTIPGGVTTIESGAFSDCDSLKELTVPENVTSLNGFANCSNLTTVYLNNSGTIKAGAFNSCLKLCNLIIGENLTTIEDEAFLNCDALVTLTVPENVTDLSGFRDCRALETVKLESARINEDAFMYCTGLKNIDFGDNITYIGRYAFGNCSSLKEVVIPDTVTEMDDYVFFGCNSLTTVNLSNSLKVIPSYAFRNCTSLVDITVPTGVEKMMGCCFYGCSNLTTIRFRGDAPEFTADTFEAITAVAYYPAENETWTDEVKQNYGGTVTWRIFDSRMDLNVDMKVDDGDVEYLLWFTLFPDMYPIETNIDLNEDGAVNDADVEYLLWHTLFPDLYPVKYIKNGCDKQ